MPRIRGQVAALALCAAALVSVGGDAEAQIVPVRDWIDTEPGSALHRIAFPDGSFAGDIVVRPRVVWRARGTVTVDLRPCSGATWSR